LNEFFYFLRPVDPSAFEEVEHRCKVAVSPLV
jgi:hypothetical protein